MGIEEAIAQCLAVGGFQGNPIPRGKTLPGGHLQLIGIDPRRPLLEETGAAQLAAGFHADHALEEGIHGC